MFSKVVLLLFLIDTCVHAYVPSHRNFLSSRNTLPFIGRSHLPVLTNVDIDTTVLKRDDDFDVKSLLSDKTLLSEVEAAESMYGMPWATSIDKNAFKKEDLLYMPFWKWHMSFMKNNLSNLRVVSCSNGKTDFSYNENKSKKARIVNICLTSDEYSKIRMTYYDAGDNTQVYNAVCYPSAGYNLPILGVDLLAFNRKKYLAIVDFQPLHKEEEAHSTEYEHLMQPIKESYKNLSGKMSSKFYDETQFFSQQMLFARFDDEKIIKDELLPAFQQYVQLHLNLVRSSESDHSAVPLVLDRQKAYDTYSAERDPAIGLFTAMFGNDWAQDFVHDFLFSRSERKGVISDSRVTQTGSAQVVQRKPNMQPLSMEAGQFAAVRC